MDTLELFSPQLEVIVGPYHLTEGLLIEVHSSRDSLFDWAKLRFTEGYQQVLELERRTEAEILLGYEGALLPVFQGYVSQNYGTGNANEILLKDAMLLLEDTSIANTFLDTTPQEMIRFGLDRAGVSNYQLTEQSYPERRMVPIRATSVRGMVDEIHRSWGLRHPYFFSGGVFYWGVDPEQPEIFRFEYGVNILAMSRVGGAWEMETVSVPFVRHSHLIEVEHPSVSGTFQVRKVAFTVTGEGFQRTIITF